MPKLLEGKIIGLSLKALYLVYLLITRYFIYNFFGWTIPHFFLFEETYILPNSVEFHIKKKKIEVWVFFGFFL